MIEFLETELFENNDVLEVTRAHISSSLKLRHLSLDQYMFNTKPRQMHTFNTKPRLTHVYLLRSLRRTPSEPAAAPDLKEVSGL